MKFVGYKQFLFAGASSLLLNKKQKLKAKMQTEDPDDLSFPMADMEELADLEGEELSEILSQQQFSQEDFQELQKYKKTMAMQPMQFKIFSHVLKNQIDDDLWHGARVHFALNASPFFKMDYSLTADSIKNLKNYRTSVMTAMPGKFRMC